MIRKFTPICYGHYLERGKYARYGFHHPMEWCFFLYLPRFYVGVNLHPNRLAQIYHSIKARKFVMDW
jgi:hypothetical protein